MPPGPWAFAAPMGDSMRSVIAATAMATLLVGTASARAERHIFIIANNPDGYGIDRCLAAGDHCGVAAANSFCRAREYAQALSFHKVDRDDITGVIPASGPGSCNGATCENYVAIECAR